MQGRPYTRALLLGASCGLRTAAAPAVVEATAGEGGVRRALSALAAAGEFAADTLPWTPSRLLWPGLSARIGAGLWCGARISLRDGGSRAAGALIGAAVAPLAAWAGYTLRRRLTVDGPFPDLPIALAEDAVALGLAFAGCAA